MVKSDLTGQVFGRLTVVCLSDRRAPRGKRTTPVWECRCDCSATVYQATDSLHREGIRMCARCRELYATEKAREGAGFVGGTQLSRIRSMNAPSTNTSSVRGVYYGPRSNKWCARLKFQGRIMNFGSFERFEDAVAARKKAEGVYFGEALEEYEGASSLS